MSLKYFLAFLIFVNLMGCKNDTKLQIIDPDNQEKNKEVRIKNKLIGDWSLNTTIDSSGLMTLCNSCPKVSFYSTTMAIVLKPSNEKEIYYWRINEKKLLISNMNRYDLTPLFPDSNYILEYSAGRDSMEVKITQPERKYSLILSR